jgi:hypothetical protein
MIEVSICCKALGVFTYGLEVDGEDIRIIRAVSGVGGQCFRARRTKETN